jgi:hypothetical protein
VFIGSTTSALDLELDGTLGTFLVKKEGTNNKSLEVKYLLTHVSLNQKAPADQKLLDKLAPVREVFDLKQLNFDEIMQRDINDSRVSLELIPYLLDSDNRGLVKLYPPIVVIVLPLEPISRKPAKLYPDSVNTEIAFQGQPELTKHIQTSGLQGQEFFQFEQVFTKSGGAFKSDGAKLRISTQNTALAIVDGQHRAMALLALYRNLKGAWGQAERQPYKHFYDVWPEALIRQFDTSAIQLPVMICTFPELSTNYAGDFDVVRAARRIFLTLNKNARKVSEARNKLLDDQDLASECLRETLALVKDANTRSKSALRIFHVELDQEADRQVISSPFAITGVPHLYAICERILFTNERISGLSAKGARMAARKQLFQAFTRLKLKDELTQAMQQESRRDNYSDTVCKLVEDRWKLTFGPLIVSLLEGLHPLKAHTISTLEIESELNRTLNANALRAILFEGHGAADVLNKFQEQLSTNMREDPASWGSPEIEATKKDIINLNKQKDDVEKELKKLRAKKYFADFNGATFKQKIRADGFVIPRFESLVTELISVRFASIAFQQALVYSLVDVLEACSVELNETQIEQYLSSLNKFLNPTTDTGLKNLVGVFQGTIVANENSLDIANSNTTFKDIVFQNEMQPDEWPKYRYLILELWNPTEPKLKTYIDNDLAVMRGEILKNVEKGEISKLLEESSKLESQLTEAERQQCMDRAQSRCKAFLAMLGK